MSTAKFEGFGGTKIALKVNNQTELTVINKELGLEPNINFLVHKYDLPLEQKYGLKIISANNKDSKRSGHYVTENTYDGDVQDANYLELVQALDEVVCGVFINIKGDNFEEACNVLFNLSSDPAVISEIIETHRVSSLLEIFLQPNLTEKGTSGCLLVILQLLKTNNLQPLKNDVLDKIIDITMMKSFTSQYGLSVLGQILYSTNVDFVPNKTHIIKNISLSYLLTYLLCKDNTDLQINALILINAILKCSKFEQRLRLIGDLSRSSNREKIFKLITEQTVTEKLARQLFLLQSYMFLIYKENLKKLALPGTADFNFTSPICFENELVFKDSDSLKTMSPAISMTSLYAKDNISRSSMISSDQGSYSSDSQVMEYNEYISVLTYNCLVYYKHRHSRSFINSQCEENSFEPGICKSSERVMRIIAETLNMGAKSSRNCTRYIPLYFNPETNNFMEELFSRMMFLLSQARREMKARLLEDYEKLIAVLKKQLEIILEKKPKDFREFQLHIREINYETVRKQWQEEKQQEWCDKLRSNPCIIDLRKNFDEINEKLIFKERMNALHKGDVFRKQPEKKHKPHQYFKFHLSPNNNILHYGDYKINENEFVNHQTVNVKDIRHIITGQACPLIKDNLIDHSLVKLVFTVVLPDNSEINCLAPNEKKANYWIDGFNILRGMPARTKDYYDDLRQLTDMDCTLHLLELQNVPFPTQRPPIPPYPESNKPEIPPKPEHLKRSISSK